MGVGIVHFPLYSYSPELEKQDWREDSDVKLLMPHCACKKPGLVATFSPTGNKVGRMRRFFFSEPGCARGRQGWPWLFSPEDSKEHVEEEEEEVEDVEETNLEGAGVKVIALTKVSLRLEASPVVKEMRLRCFGCWLLTTCGGCCGGTAGATGGTGSWSRPVAAKASKREFSSGSQEPPPVASTSMPVGAERLLADEEEEADTST